MDLLERYLLPMSGAIWSTHPDKMMDFPAMTLVRFFKNHGLLGLTTHYQWKTVLGGSRVYRDKVLSFFPESVRLGRGARLVTRGSDGVKVQDASGAEEIFEKVVIATHANDALHLLNTPTALEADLLSRFRYQTNRACLHTDDRVMPRRRPAWSSWNYRAEKDGTPSVIYWMNSLQAVSKKKDYFVSINDPGHVDSKRVLWQGDYEHPVYDLKAVAAQKRLSELNNTGPVFFCGSYFKYGFHEDAFSSGMAAAGSLLGKRVSL